MNPVSRSIQVIHSIDDSYDGRGQEIMLAIPHGQFTPALRSGERTVVHPDIQIAAIF